MACHAPCCSLRSGSPVPNYVVPNCPPLPLPKGGCPPSAIPRCGQYSHCKSPDPKCIPAVAPFYAKDMGCKCTDNRGALRPDARDCPALGRTFCMHDPAQPFTRCSGAINYPSDFLNRPTGGECDILKPRGLVRAAVAIGMRFSGGGKRKNFCAPSEGEYPHIYCGVSGNNFPMYCASSGGVTTSPPSKITGAAHKTCPAGGTCCAVQPFGVRCPAACVVDPCVPHARNDPCVARRVGGFKLNMPSPTTWI